MRMREVEGGIPLPPGETVKLQPGGFHIMLLGLKQGLTRRLQLPPHPDFREGRQRTGGRSGGSHGIDGTGRPRRNALALIAAAPAYDRRT